MSATKFHNLVFQYVPHPHLPRDFSARAIAGGSEARCKACGKRIVRRRGERWKLVVRQSAN
jgi:hypothetical protein